jgi:hypothetical protein
MDNKESSSLKPAQTVNLRTAAITTIAVMAGILLAAGIIYLSGLVNFNRPGLQADSTGAAPFGYLIAAGKQADKGECGTEGQSSAETSACLNRKKADSCLANGKTICAEDLEIARIAWVYFENNYNPETGLYNSANKYTSTTMWDTGSALAATIAARDFGFIDQKTFDDRVMAMFKTLNTMKLFNNEAPNKAYNTKSADMVDYRNKPVPDGIGVSMLDLGRLVSWLNTVQCMHPKYKTMAKKTIERWDFSRMMKDGQMYGLARDPETKKIRVLQEGRFVYEQYTGKVFRTLGFDMNVAATYNNKFRNEVDVMGIPIAHDNRDPREFGANNYVITESYSMDATENGLDNENTGLLKNIFEVQKERWKRTGTVTAVSEDNVDRDPWFLYNSIFNAGIQWSTINPRGTRFNELKSVSTKAALSLAVLFPDDEYSQVLMDKIESAYDPEKGWYSGVYENGIGYNTTATANTNGNIMANMLYKKYGSFFELCGKCQRIIQLDDAVTNNGKTCDVCTVSRTTPPADQYAGSDQD